MIWKILMDEHFELDRQPAIYGAVEVRRQA
jgi:hypothetical protein